MRRRKPEVLVDCRTAAEPPRPVRNVPALHPHSHPHSMHVYWASICQRQSAASPGSNTTPGADCPANSIDPRLLSCGRMQTRCEHRRLASLVMHKTEQLCFFWPKTNISSQSQGIRTESLFFSFFLLISPFLQFLPFFHYFFIILSINNATQICPPLVNVLQPSITLHIVLSPRRPRQPCCVPGHGHPGQTQDLEVSFLRHRSVPWSLRRRGCSLWLILWWIHNSLLP